MLKIKSIAVLGGDVRQKHLASFLADEGFSVSSTQKLCSECNVFSDCENCIDASDAVLLPLPVTKDGRTLYCEDEEIFLDDIVRYIDCDKIVFCGKMDDAFKQKLDEKNVKWFDYFSDEEMTVKNAIATAEGAVALAVENTPRTLFASKVLVTGYGRIAKALTKMLSAFGCDVTVAARSGVERIWASLDGANAVELEALTQKNAYSIIFNTVPHIIFTKKELYALERNALIIDLASFPGGVDKHVAKSLGVNVITAGGLPSRFSAQCAGEFIGQTVLKIIKEEF